MRKPLVSLSGDADNTVTHSSLRQQKPAISSLPSTKSVYKLTRSSTVSSFASGQPGAVDLSAKRDKAHLVSSGSSKTLTFKKSPSLFSFIFKEAPGQPIIQPRTHKFLLPSVGPNVILTNNIIIRGDQRLKTYSFYRKQRRIQFLSSPNSSIPAILHILRFQADLLHNATQLVKWKASHEVSILRNAVALAKRANLLEANWEVDRSTEYLDTSALRQLVASRANPFSDSSHKDIWHSIFGTSNCLSLQRMIRITCSRCNATTLESRVTNGLSICNSNAQSIPVLLRSFGKKQKITNSCHSCRTTCVADSWTNFSRLPSVLRLRVDGMSSTGGIDKVQLSTDSFTKSYRLESVILQVDGIDCALVSDGNCWIFFGESIASNINVLELVGKYSDGIVELIYSLE